MGQEKLCVPRKVGELVGSVGSLGHPGLTLDKFSIQNIPGWDSNKQKTALLNLVSLSGKEEFLESLLKHRDKTLKALGAEEWNMDTAGPFSLHLSRGSALENAGLCLHPLYGFAYIPGTGLKGLARAYAETIWFRSEKEGGKDEKELWERIRGVFGWGKDTDQGKDWAPEGFQKEASDESSGSIRFHEAWPLAWPKLMVDIVNNHHAKYYGSEKETDPPGDWEDPSLNYFLAVREGTPFNFALSKREGDVPDDLLVSAKEWLVSALVHLGAGAKTNAGYGRFKPTTGNPTPVPTPVLPKTGERESLSGELELVTPAFLAGANQEKADCDLRVPTLRGQLRWWWRTLHAGHLSVQNLRALESVIWGSTENGGLVSITLEAKPPGVKPECYDKYGMGLPDKNGPYGIPKGTQLNKNGKILAQGFWYLSYGMDETDKNKVRSQRPWIKPGTKWKLIFTARTGKIAREDEPIFFNAATALYEAKRALWLLCRFGGVGSRSRKGFGSLRFDSPSFYRDDILEALPKHEKNLRENLGFQEEKVLEPYPADIEHRIGIVEVVFKWENVYKVLDQVGFSYQSFAIQHRRRSEKFTLGLPRKQSRDSFSPTGPFQEVFEDKGPVKARYASPLHIHLDNCEGVFRVRVSAWPAPGLPNVKDSKVFLEQALAHLKKDLGERASRPEPDKNKPFWKNVRR